MQLSYKLAKNCHVRYLPYPKFALVTAHLMPYTKSHRFVASGLGYASWFLFCYRLNVISYRAMKCVFV